MLDDLRHAIRSVTRTKGLTAILLISLGLGTGVNAAAGGALYALLFGAPSGIGDASHLVSLYTSQFSGEAHGPSSYPDYQSLQAQASSFEAIAAVGDRGFQNAGPPTFARRARVAAVSNEFFTVLRMTPHRGRLLDSGDSEGGDTSTDTRINGDARTSADAHTNAETHTSANTRNNADARTNSAANSGSGTGTGTSADTNTGTATDTSTDTGVSTGPDTGSGAQPAVISHSLWTEIGRPDVPGPIEIGERTYTLVGVAPPRFRGLQAGRPTDAWIPLAPPVVAARGDRGLALLARLAGGARLSDASTELDRIASDLARRFPATNRGTVHVADAARRLTARLYSPLDPDARSRTSLIAALVGGAVVLLLLSACINAGSLLLSRIIARRGEVAVRMTMGATRGRLLRMLLLESLLIALAGGALGLLLAIWTAGLILSRLSPDQAQMLDVRVDVGLVLMSAGVAAIAGTLVGLVPALQGTRGPVAAALRAGPGAVSSQHGGGRLRTVLVGAQIALSTLLLIAAAFLVRGLTRALESDFGVLARRVAVFSLENRGEAARARRYLDDAAESLPKIGGVEAVGWMATLPLALGSTCALRIAADDAGTTDLVDLPCNVVTPTYFETLDTPLLEGRTFNDGDHVRAPLVVIVDELLARRYFAGKAIGRTLLAPQGKPLTIVGIVPDARYRTMQAEPQPTVYFPFSQKYQANGYLLVRTRGDPTPLLGSIAARLTGLDARMVIQRSSTLDAHLAEALPIDRVITVLTAACGLIALAMAAIGVYGVTADAVQRRTREIGVRVALGASRPHVVRLVFTEALSFSVAGVSAGIAAALAIERLVRSLVDGVPSLEARSVAMAPVILAVVVVLAAILPVRRALRVSPTIALRAE